MTSLAFDSEGLFVCYGEGNNFRSEWLKGFQK